MAPVAQWRFDDLYQRHFREVLAYCLRRAPAEDGYDAANEVFMTAWRRIDDVPGGDAALPWLYVVARRVLHRRWRSASRFRRLVARAESVPARPSTDPETVVVRRAEYDAVLEAVSRLSSRDREILGLAAWEGLAHRDIAEVLGCSIDAVDQRLHQAKKRLARHYHSVDLAGSLRRAGRVTNRE
jgi:RNA polymerase sigma factor (sigma-70 family)